MMGDVFAARRLRSRLNELTAAKRARQDAAFRNRSIEVLRKAGEMNSEQY